MLKATSKDCAEILLMGINKKFHRLGVGTLLHEAYAVMAKEQGYTYSQVKTVQSGHKEYDATNNFYVAMGYKELEYFPTLWTAGNPCQIYINYLGS